LEGGKKKILIIDDDKSILEIFELILQKEGYITDKAETGQEALSKLKNGFFDVALIDVKLPDMEGTDLLNIINKSDLKIIKIMVTGYPSEESHTKAVKSGADDYLVKPLDPRELIRILNEKLKHKT
jgi:two-component system response regulator PilR (NtrC family)